VHDGFCTDGLALTAAISKTAAFSTMDGLMPRDPRKSP
jgi:hypothetical protein